MPAGPQEWDRRTYIRHQHIQDYLKVDGLTVKYIGPGELDQQAAAIFADKPVPADVPLYYYEVTIINKGDSGYIGIGFCTDTVNLGRLPGWEPHSYGYHGDDGHAFHGGGQGRPYGPGFTTGDVVGALLDRSRKTISYYKNGEPVGVAFYDVQEQQLYPCVGMRTKHEEIRANFGATAFCVDVKKLHAEFKERVLADIAAVQLPVTVAVPTSADGCSAAAAAAAAAATAPSSSSSKGLEAAAAACRQAIRALDSSRSATLASLEAATQAYLEALEAAAGDVCSSPGLAAAGSRSGVGGQEGPSTSSAAAAAGSGALKGSQETAAGAAAAAAAGTVSQPLMLYYVFNYLLHRRCWKTAAIVAQEMLAASASSSSSQQGVGSADPAASADPTAAAAGAGDVDMGDAVSAGGAAQDDQEMPDAAVDTAAAPTAAAAAGVELGSSNAAASTSTSSSSAAAVMGAFSEADVQDALRRQKIYDAICAGSIADALAIVRAQYGTGVLQHNPHLTFKLKVQQFVELVRSACTCSSASQQQQQQQQQQDHHSPGAAAASNGAAAAGGGSSSTSGFEAALTYGRAELGPASKSEQDEELLSDALSLLAYSDPAASPCGHLLRESYRADLAEELNGALLKARGSSGKPLLECAYRQAVVLVKELKASNLPAALVLDVPGLCSGTSSSS